MVAPYDLNATTSFFLDSMSPVSWWSLKSDTPVDLLYGSNLGNPDGNYPVMDLINCGLGIAGVEPGILCYGASCAVDRMRRSTKDTKSPYAVPFNYQQSQDMLLFIPFATGKPHSATASPIGQYMLGSTNPLGEGPPNCVRLPRNHRRSLLQSTSDPPQHSLASLNDTIWSSPRRRSQLHQRSTSPRCQYNRRNNPLNPDLRRQLHFHHHPPCHFTHSASSLHRRPHLQVHSHST